MYLSDATTEAIALRLVEQPRGLVVAMDELSALFGGMNQYKSRGNDRESYLAFYDAAAAKIDRKTSTPPTVFIPRAFVAVTGMIQPGTLARCLGRRVRLRARRPVPAGSASALRAVWADTEVCERARNGWHELIGVMLNHPLPASPALIAPSASAMSLWAKAHDRLEAERHAEADDRMRAARSKLIGLIPRLSLVFQVVSAASGEGHATVKVIDEKSMERAIAIAQWATAETRRVYRVLAGQGTGADESEVIRLIEARGGQISVRGLMQACRQFRSSANAAKSLSEQHGRRRLGAVGLAPDRGTAQPGVRAEPR